MRLLRDVPAGLPEPQGLETELRDALLNLIFNAVDAMPRGGDLILRTRLVQAESGDGDTVSSRLALEVSDRPADQFCDGAAYVGQVNAFEESSWNRYMRHRGAPLTS